MSSINRVAWRQAVMLLLFFVGNWLTLPCHAQQPFYESKHFNPAIPAVSTSLLGILYNPQPYLITNTPTTYHGNQNVYATAYLPFIAQEYDPANAIQLFGPSYTTAVALCSVKDPAKELYAPIHIISQEPKSDIIHALASVVPYNPNIANFKGPFNKLEKLNEAVPGFVNPVTSEYGITALKTAQEFTKFSHDLLTDENGIGWNGFDKAGNIPIACLVKPTIGETGYYGNGDYIVFYKYTSGNIDLTRVIVGHEFAHGIVDHSPAFNNSIKSQTRNQMEEGFANIIGLAFSNWLNPSKFENPNWNMNWEIPTDPLFFLNNPKARFRPSTYKGEFYKEDWLIEGYDEHDNGHILGYAFTLIVKR